jgi:hypothetical protein
MKLRTFMSSTMRTDGPLAHRGAPRKLDAEPVGRFARAPDDVVAIRIDRPGGGMQNSSRIACPTQPIQTEHRRTITDCGSAIKHLTCSASAIRIVAWATHGVEHHMSTTCHNRASGRLFGRDGLATVQVLSPSPSACSAYRPVGYQSYICALPERPDWVVGTEQIETGCPPPSHGTSLGFLRAGHVGFDKSRPVTSGG